MNRNSKIGIKGYFSIDPVVRFFEKVEKTKSCWLWKGAKNPLGYGYFWNGKQNMRPHRWAYEYFNNLKIKRGNFICHRCDTPSCVNPEHLFEGTPQKNVDDAVRKKRHKFTLTDEDVNIIRTLHSKGMLQKDIADIFYVHFGTISKIILGIRRKVALAKIEALK